MRGRFDGAPLIAVVATGVTAACEMGDAVTSLKCKPCFRSSSSSPDAYSLQSVESAGVQSRSKRARSDVPVHRGDAGLRLRRLLAHHVRVTNLNVGLFFHQN